MRLRTLLCLILTVPLSVLRNDVYAQEMWGAASSNFAGHSGLALNPASIADAPYRWEVHFLSFDASLLNNYMYLQSKSKLIRKSLMGESLEEDRVTDRYTRRPDKFGYASASLNYPSFIWSGKKLSLAFHLSTRFEFSASNIPFHFAKYMKEGFDYDPQQRTSYSTDRARAGLLNWHEAGFTIAGVLYDVPETYWTGGLTLNYNYGLNGLFMKLDELDYSVPFDSLLIVNDISAEYGHALPENGTKGPDGAFDKRGGGYSLTGGVQFFRNRNMSYYDPCKYKPGDKPYDYRLGFSLIDVGYLKFTKGTRTFRFTDESADWYGIDTVKFGSLTNLDSTLSKEFLNSYFGSRDGRSMFVYLPAAISVQYDYALNGHWFLNFTAIQRLPLGAYGLRRANQLSLTPRYESRRFECALPLSFYELFRPRVGLALRWGILTIGTDMISPLVGITDAYGADFYFGISLKNFSGCDGSGWRMKRRHSIEKCNTPK